MTLEHSMSVPFLAVTPPTRRNLPMDAANIPDAEVTRIHDAGHSSRGRP
jgi:hypothetical protein